MSVSENGGTQHPMPASRLAAELGHYASVRRVDVQFPDRLLLKVTDDGLSRGPLRTIRELGWMVSGFTIRRNTVSVVQNDRCQGTGSDSIGFTLGRFGSGRGGSQ